MWEKTLLLVEIACCDSLHGTVHGTTNNEIPEYGLMLWYYQFIRAESFISIGVSFIILTIIVIVWWYFSFQQESETYELYGMTFPNESLEWWYDDFLETLILASYFIYMSFFDLYFYWKPVEPNWTVNRTEVSFPRRIMAERTWNIVRRFCHPREQHLGQVMPMESWTLEIWTRTEINAGWTTRQVRKREAFEGLGWFESNYALPAFTEKLRFWMFIKLPKLTRYKLSTYNPQLYYVKRVREMRMKSKYMLSTALKQGVWRIYEWQIIAARLGTTFMHRERYMEKRRRAWYVKRKKYVGMFIRFFNRFFGKASRINIDIENLQHARAVRGAGFVRYHYFIRGYRKLLPNQKVLQHLIMLRRPLEMFQITRRRLSSYPLMPHFWDRYVIKGNFYNKRRPKWHLDFFEFYWVDNDEGGRGGDYVTFSDMHWKQWVLDCILLYVHHLCWEDDEIEMYEDEFEDWNMEFDPESGDIEYDGMDYGYDEDLRSLVADVTEEQAARYHSAEKQLRIDEAIEEDQWEEINSEDYEIDDVWSDPELEVYGVDYYSAIFEYYTDPVFWSLELRNMHPEMGLDMPPAWGSLNEQGAVYRTFMDRADGLINSYYYYNHVNTVKGTSFHKMWWDLSVKAWQFDGYSLSYMRWAGGPLKKIFEWYFGEYCKRKAENEPEVYKIMKEMDVEHRKSHPHYHGMTFWNGYYVPKPDAGIEYEKALASLPEEYRKIVFEYNKKTRKRVARDEYIPDDDYRDIIMPDGQRLGDVIAEISAAAAAARAADSQKDKKD